MKHIPACAFLTQTVVALVFAYGTNSPGWWLVAVSGAAAFSVLIGYQFGAAQTELRATQFLPAVWTRWSGREDELG